MSTPSPSSTVLATAQRHVNYLSLSDGAKLAYTIYGKEHLNSHRRVLPLVLVGGSGSTQVDWEVLIPHLTKTRTVLTFDHRGIGLSTYSTPANNDKLTIESMTQDIICLIESLNWRNVDILSYSMGGVLLQCLLLFQYRTGVTLPFRVHHALLTSTLPSSLPGGYPSLKPFPTDRDVGEDEKRELFMGLLEAVFSPEWVASPKNHARFTVWFQNCYVNRSFKTIMKQRKMIANFSFTQDLKNIDKRTRILVIHGMGDLIVPFTSAEEILRACPQARLVTIGSKRGQVPSYAFGHLWYEFFDIEVWVGVLETFLDDGGFEFGSRGGAKL